MKSDSAGFKRCNGFTWPLCVEQIIVICSYIFGVISFFLFIAGRLSESFPAVILFSIDTALIIIVITSWIIASGVNPETLNKNKDITDIEHGCCNFKQQMKRTTRFCGRCRKYIYQMDHHCTFLNNCIGGHNYAAFIWLIVTAMIEFALQTVSMILMMTIWYDEELLHYMMLNNIILYFTIAGLAALISFIFCIFAAVLVAFHMYLFFYCKMGTYDHMLYNRSRHLGSPTLHSSAEEENNSDSMRLESLRQKQREDYQQTVLRKQATRAQIMSLDPQSSKEIYELNFPFVQRSASNSVASHGSLSKSVSVHSHQENEQATQYDNVGCGDHSSYTFGNAPVKVSARSELYIIRRPSNESVGLKSDDSSEKRDIYNPPNDSSKKSNRDESRRALSGNEDISSDEGGNTPTFRTRMTMSDKNSTKSKGFVHGSAKVLPVDGTE